MKDRSPSSSRSDAPFDVLALLRPLSSRLSAAASGVTTANLLQRLVLIRGDDDAVVLHSPLDIEGFDHRVWTYADLADFVERVAAALHHDLGVRPGHVVAICTANGLDMPLTTLAVARLGATAVPLNHQMRADEIRFIVRDSGATVLIADAHLQEEVRTLAQSEGGRGPLRHVAWAASAPPAATRPVQDTSISFFDLTEALARPPRALPPSAVDEDAVAAIFYTSGTTGFPKGAMLTSRSLLSGFRWLMLRPRWPRFSVLQALPTAHIMGFASFVGFVLAGLRTHYLDKFDAAQVLDLLEHEDIDGFIGVPSMYQLLSEAGAMERDLSSTRVFASAADVMPGHLIESFKQRGRLLRPPADSIPAAFLEVYGSVELSGAAMVRLSLPWVPPATGGFVGLPLPGYRARIVDDAGDPLGPGQPGELMVRGPGVFKGYHGNPDAGQGALEDGWLRTGDLAERTRLGFIRFIGREKDVIKSGGYSVFPAEIETRLLKHPDVAKVAVVGIPHPTLGAIPIAVIVPGDRSSPTEAEILKWLKGRLSRYKAPRRVVFIRPEEMPYGATGKIEKRKLQERFAALEAELA